MTSGNAYPNQPEPDTSRERIELETRVLAAALRQSLERGDTAGSSHAHQQIFILLKASQEMGWEEPISLPPELLLDKEARRPMPDIDWGAPAGGPIIPPQSEPQSEAEAQEEIKPEPGIKVEASFTPETSFTAERTPEPAPDLEHQSAALADETAAGPGLAPVIAAAAPLLPLVKIPTFALVPVPSFTTSTPVTGAAAVSDFYLRLQVSHMADFSSIHRSFLRKVRPLLREYASGTLVGQAKKDLLNSLQSLWIAHDILCDPVTRTDYDFRRMGLRGGLEDGIEGKPSLANRPQLRIGELLMCAGLLETTELEIAADMHKAMPELMFGAFLVKQGFIEEDDLNCVLLGQQLLKTGGITAAQFQESMAERTSSGKDFGDILVKRRYLTPMQLQDAYRNQMDDTLPRLPAVVSTVSLQDSAADIARVLDGGDDEQVGEDVSVIESEQVSETDSVGEPVKAESEELDSAASRPHELLNSSPSLNAGNAVPSWKDQLDWDSPAEGETLNAALVDTSTDIKALPHPAQANVAPSLASLYDSPDQRSDTAELPPSSSTSSTPSSPTVSPFARPEPSKKKSLTDLMADLEPSYLPPEEEIPQQSPFASIWADNSKDTSSDLISDMVQPVASTVSLPHSAQDDFAPPSLEHDEDLSLVEEEFAALDAAADEALHIGEQDNEAAAEVNALQSSSLPISAEQQQESGSWQIVSVPASALASLLLDDEPEAGEAKVKAPAPGVGKERRQLKTSFANDKPFAPRSSNDDNAPPDDDRRSRRRKPRPET
ncbi:hypothetical protein KBI23_18230 [bacterium]|nr:hypothetical protein [bacterium]MBP9810853.1 hypothetical protein [bacterium]